MTETRIRTIDGRALAIRGDDIDTDRIIPARFLKEITFENMGKYVFHDVRFDEAGGRKPHPFNEAANEGACLLFVNANFGCGSSREHAPQALYRWGIRAIVGVSFGEIFAGNSEMLGMPTATASAETIAALQDAAETAPATEWTLSLESMTVSGGGLELPVHLAENRRKALLEGYWDSTATLVTNAALVEQVAARLPYMHGYD